MEHIVSVIDNDTRVRQFLVRLLRSQHFHVADFASVQAFLRRQISPVPSCVIVDINLPATDEDDVVKALVKIGRGFPVIFYHRQRYHPDVGEGDKSRRF
ncbi:response regulator [Acerihabitans sp. KWT182]|uniref:Response regulator n=1 Tax=Acerihabitans sp. KWT182 TaxID=3157919 RepID=A0AAU7QFQ8_9GAMM